MAKTKVLISCAVAVQLCSYCLADLALYFAYANCWFSHVKAQILNYEYLYEDENKLRPKNETFNGEMLFSYNIFII